MKRIGIGLALTALLGLAACGSSDSSGSPKTKNAALPSTTTTPPTTAPTPTTPATTSPAAPSTTSAPCVTQFIGKVLKACKPYKTIYYTYFSATSAISGQVSSGAGTTSNTWTEQDFTYASLPSIYLDIALDYADGTKMPTTRYPLDLRGSTPRAALAAGAACVPVMDRVIFKACKPYKTIYYTYFSATSAISGQVSSGAGTTSNTWTEQHFAYASLPTIYVDVALDYADGTKMPTTRFRLDLKSMAEAVVAEPATIAPTTTSTLPKPAPTTTVNLPTTTVAPKTAPCTISWDGTRLVACKAFRELKYQYFDAKGPVGGQLGGTTADPQTSSNLSSKSYPGTTSVRISITFADGSAVSNVDLGIGATVAAPFSAGPTPTTAPPSPGCDLRVSFGAVSSTCGMIKAYSYQWHNGTGTISGTMSSSSPKGWGTIYLGSFAPPKAATGALMTFTFVDGRKTRSVLIPLSQPTATIRAPF